MPGWTEALPEFDLPETLPTVEGLPSPLPGLVEAVRVQLPGGRRLLLQSTAPLSLAFEATLFDLLAENRYPAPRPIRARGGSLIARLGRPGPAAACYAWPPGEDLSPLRVLHTQLLELGRLLARLHQLGEAHPAKVPDGAGAALLAQVLPGREREALSAVMEAPLAPLPSGAIHGWLGPGRALFMGDRCSAVLPSGVACFGPLLLDVAECVASLLAEAPQPLVVLQSVVSGYQSLRKLLPEEARALPQVLRLAAARDGARRAAWGEGAVLAALEAARELSDEEIRATAAA
jgi:Ser/Thr protein kinase RdoA (MazF antagonist)